MTGPRSKSCDIEGTLIRGGEKLKAILLDNDSFCIRRCQQTLEDGAKCGGNLLYSKKKGGGCWYALFKLLPLMLSLLGINASHDAAKLDRYYRYKIMILSNKSNLKIPLLFLPW